MALRRKVLLVIGASLAGLIVVLYLVSRALILNSFLNLEDQEVRRNIQRVVNTLQTEIHTLSGSASDWAYWDDTYQFVQTGDPAYVDSNLNDSTFTGLSLNLMIMMNREGTAVVAQNYDLANSQFVDLPTGLDPFLGQSSPFFTTQDQDDFSGIVLVGQTPMLMVSRAILQNGEKGPLAGTLLFGRILDDTKLERIAQDTQTALAIHTFDAAELPADFQTARSTLITQDVVVIPADDNMVNGYTILRDMGGAPALYLRVQLPREIYVQGQNNLSAFILGILLVGLIMIAVTLVLIERLVLRHLYDLSREMETVSLSGDPKARLTITGSDELAALGHDINKMLTAIEQAQITVRQNEERLHKSLDELEKSQSELDDNDHQLQITLSRLEKHKRQLLRMHEFMHSTVAQMESSLQHGASSEEIAEYLKSIQVQLKQLDTEISKTTL